MFSHILKVHAESCQVCAQIVHVSVKAVRFQIVLWNNQFCSSLFQNKDSFSSLASASLSCNLSILSMLSVDNNGEAFCSAPATSSLARWKTINSRFSDPAPTDAPTQSRHVDFFRFWPRGIWCLLNQHAVHHTIRYEKFASRKEKFTIRYKTFTTVWKVCHTMESLPYDMKCSPYAMKSLPYGIKRLERLFGV